MAGQTIHLEDVLTIVDGHQDLPSDGHEASAGAITESDHARQSSRRSLPKSGDVVALGRVAPCRPLLDGS